MLPPQAYGGVTVEGAYPVLHDKQREPSLQVEQPVAHAKTYSPNSTAPFALKQRKHIAKLYIAECI